MKKTNKRVLYERIMKDVAKTVKKHLNENNLLDEFDIDTYFDEDSETWAYDIYNKNRKVVLSDNDFDSEDDAYESAVITLNVCAKGKHKNRLYR